MKDGNEMEPLLSSRKRRFTPRFSPRLTIKIAISLWSKIKLRNSPFDETKDSLTVYLVVGIALICVAGVIWSVVESQRYATLERLVTEAGGTVIYTSSSSAPPVEFEIGNTFFVFDYNSKPTAIEISSGSHPIKQVLELVNSTDSITQLTLSTSDVGDHYLAHFLALKHVDTLDLRQSEITNQAAIAILDGLPKLKKLELSSEFHDRSEIAHLHPGRLEIHP